MKVTKWWKRRPEDWVHRKPEDHPASPWSGGHPEQPEIDLHRTGTKAGLLSAGSSLAASRKRHKEQAGTQRVVVERDSRRSRLYDAELALDKLPQRVFKTVPEIQEFVDLLVGSVWFRHRFPAVTRIEVRDGRRRKRAGFRGNAIFLPCAWRSERHVLHQVAHVIAQSVSAERADERAVAMQAEVSIRPSAHGRLFARAYLALVERTMGRPAANVLKDAFRDYGVRYTAVRPGTSKSPKKTFFVSPKFRSLCGD